MIPSLNLLESVAASELSSSVKSPPEIWTHTREELKILRPDVYIDTTQHTNTSRARQSLESRTYTPLKSQLKYTYSISSDMNVNLTHFKRLKPYIHTHLVEPLIHNKAVCSHTCSSLCCGSGVGGGGVGLKIEGIHKQGRGREGGRDRRRSG